MRRSISLNFMVEAMGDCILGGAGGGGITFATKNIVA